MHGNESRSIASSERIKIVFGRALPRSPLGELTTLPPDHLVGWEGDTPPHIPPSRRLDP